MHLFIFALGLCILDVTYRSSAASRTTPCWHAHPLPFSVYILEGDSIDRLSLAVNNNTAHASTNIDATEIISYEGGVGARGIHAQWCYEYYPTIFSLAYLAKRTDEPACCWISLQVLDALQQKQSTRIYSWEPSVPSFPRVKNYNLNKDSTTT